MIRQVAYGCVFALAGWTAWAVAGPQAKCVATPAARPAARPVGVAIVELFTSQGCSSCPPAEGVLGELSQAARLDGRPVYALAFHVDYWNHGGWADPFSAAAFSDRQRQYGRAFSLDQIYTPQMVVNGRTQFVGSDGSAADRAIADALATPAAVPVTVAVAVAGRSGHRVHYAAPNAGADAVVNVAVVERGLATDVKGGENGGSHLDQPDVVRWFTTGPARDADDVAIPPLPAVHAGRASVVVYVQAKPAGPVVGATAAPLP